MSNPGSETILAVPPQKCSPRRREYFERANRMLGTYSVVSAYSHFGQQAVDRQMSRGGQGDETPVRVNVGDRLWMSTYGVARRLFSTAGTELANQCFLMVYGNFEAFVVNLVHDALQQKGSEDAVQESIGLMMGVSWEGKLDRLGARLGVALGKSVRASGFSGVDMVILGRKCDDPAHVLNGYAEIRHRLAHGSGLVDPELLAKYPGSGRTEGEHIALPMAMPFDLHTLFFVPLTDVVDEAFCRQFKWSRETVAVETLVGFAAT